MKPAYYICYFESSNNYVGSEITEIYHPFEYVMAYFNQYKRQIHIQWWKELTANELMLAKKVGSIAMNLLK